ncbi:MAG TPA: ATP-binding cassette domain-containing protein, partial [Elusimicrobiota bacterium]|nr:ATP-binding cassette domain-containing protein [Elusimicrobiota bacterium]
MTALLEIRDLRVEYRRGNVAAVRGVSIDLAPGESLGLAGESGSGKSTLALSVLRLLAPEAVRAVTGRILFKGRDVLTLADRELRSLRGGAV